MPERRHTSVDSPASSRWPSSGAISPGFNGFWNDHGPLDASRGTIAHRGSLASEGTHSHRNSYDHLMFINDDFAEEEGQMNNLNLHDRSPGSPKAGAKRRASSPPRDRGDRSSVSSASGHSEIYHRRSMQQLPNRCSPVSRFHPNHSSLSSASSLGPRHGSLSSSLGIASIPSSATSYGSGRVSPSTASSCVDSDARMDTPTSAHPNTYPSPNVSHHQRAFSESTQGGARKMSIDSTSHSRHGSLSQNARLLHLRMLPKETKEVRH